MPGGDARQRGPGHIGAPAVTDEKQLMDLINGKTSPMKALLFGKVRIQGDVKPLLQLCALL